MDLIPQSGFAGFLLWLYLTQKKDTQQLRTDAKEEEEKLRIRYDKVITDLQSEKELANKNLRDQVNSLDTRLSELDRILIQLVTRLEAITANIAEIKKSKDHVA